MKPYLVFRLYAPLASWGLPAIGETRPTQLHPSRSAILGLLGAALGIKRDDEHTLNQLKRSVHIAIKQTTRGSLLYDYHTAQMPSRNMKAVFNTRKDELADKKLNTVLSNRYYRCDSLWVIAIFLTKSASYTLEQIQGALLEPVYTLYLGRKSCPPALPLAPKLLPPCSLKKALDTPFPSLTTNQKSDDRWLKSNQLSTYFWEGDKEALGVDKANIVGHIQTTQPCDEPISRKHWQFEQRTLHQASLNNKEGS